MQARSSTGRYERMQSSEATCWSADLFTDQHLQQAMDQAVRSSHRPGSTQLIVMRLEAEDPLGVLGRDVERRVFAEFFGNNLELMDREYGPYETYSMFLVALDVVAMRPAGVVRAIRGDRGPLKTLVDIASADGPWRVGIADLMSRTDGAPIPLERTLDIATLAVAPEYRAGSRSDGVSSYLYRAMVAASQFGNYSHWVGIIDEIPLAKIQMLGTPLKFFRGLMAASYLDSPLSVPFYSDLDHIADGLRPLGLEGFFFRGEGIDPGVEFIL